MMKLKFLTLVSLCGLSISHAQASNTTVYEEFGVYEKRIFAPSTGTDVTVFFKSSVPPSTKPPSTNPPDAGTTVAFGQDLLRLLKGGNTWVTDPARSQIHKQLQKKRQDPDMPSCAWDSREWDLARTGLKETLKEILVNLRHGKELKGVWPILKSKAIIQGAARLRGKLRPGVWDLIVSFLPLHNGDTLFD